MPPNKRPRRRRHWGRTRKGGHVPVLLREVLGVLAPRPGQMAVDCTLGYGGHAEELLRLLGPSGLLVGLDVDGEQLQRTRERLAPLNLPMRLHRANFRELPQVLAGERIGGTDILLADLGVSSMQIDEEARGMHYRHKDAPLDMRMDSRLNRTAADLLAEMPEAELAAALAELSDEPDAGKIARWIVRERRVTPFERTGQLTRLILHAKGLTERGANDWRKSPASRHGELHPAAQTFQALRMLVNDELGSLRCLLEAAPGVLKPGGRVAIISFHSGEDRLVKQALRAGYEDGAYEAVSTKAIMPRPAEKNANPRSASAKLRWARRAET